MGTVDVDIHIGDCRDVLRAMPDESVHCVVTSPPYWGLRDYRIEPSIWGGDGECEHAFAEETVTAELRTGLGMAALGERYRGGGKKAGAVPTISAQRGFCVKCGAWRGALGLEPTYQLYVEHIVIVFREVHRVLRKDGTLWLNLGDCYATGAGKVGDHPGGGEQGKRWRGGTSSRRPAMGKHAYIGDGIVGNSAARPTLGATSQMADRKIAAIGPLTQPNRMPQSGLKPKDLVGIPWRVALALQDDGWWLRRDIIWAKPNPMPESTRDRCTTAHEYLFHFARSERYFYDADAIKEPADGWDTGAGGHGSFHRDGREKGRRTSAPKHALDPDRKRDGRDGTAPSSRAIVATRNKRSVWTIATQPFPDAHFATFPTSLVEPCILAGCPPGGVILDPFGGAGTVGLVASRLQRHAVLIERNPDYAAMTERRIIDDAPLMAAPVVRDHAAETADQPTLFCTGGAP